MEREESTENQPKRRTVTVLGLVSIISSLTGFLTKLCDFFKERKRKKQKQMADELDKKLEEEILENDNATVGSVLEKIHEELKK